MECLGDYIHSIYYHYCNYYTITTSSLPKSSVSFTLRNNVDAKLYCRLTASTTVRVAFRLIETWIHCFFIVRGLLVCHYYHQISGCALGVIHTRTLLENFLSGKVTHSNDLLMSPDIPARVWHFRWTQLTISIWCSTNFFTAWWAE